MSDPLTAPAIDLLNSRRIATLATLEADGRIHLTAVWYMYSDGRLWIPTVSTYRKVQNLRQRPTASLMVDSRSDSAMKGVSIQGRAELVQAPQAYSINKRIHARYLTPQAAAHPQIGPLFEEGDDTTIVIYCDTVRAWDMTDGDLAGLFVGEGLLRPLEP